MVFLAFNILISHFDLYLRFRMHQMAASSRIDSNAAEMEYGFFISLQELTCKIMLWLSSIVNLLLISFVFFVRVHIQE